MSDYEKKKWKSTQLQAGRVWRPSGVTPLNRWIQKSSNKDHSWQKLNWYTAQWVAMIKEKNYGLKIRNKLVHPWWLTTVSLPGMGQPWKIITLSSNPWVSIEQKTYFWVWKNDPERGGATMQTSLILGVTKYPIQTLYSSKIRSPHMVHRAWTHEANIAGRLNTIHPWGWGLETHCSSSGGECLKKGREVNRSYHEMTIWKRETKWKFV